MNARKFLPQEAPDTRSGSSLSDRTVLDLYPKVLRELPVGLFLLQLENPTDLKTLRIVYANPAATAITGKAVPMLVGKTLGDFPSLLEKPIPSQWLTALRSAEARDLGEVSMGEEGMQSQRFYTVRVFPVSSNLCGIVLEDITDRKVAEKVLRENEERLRLLVQGVQKYAIFQLDPAGRVVTWNAGAERLKGYSSEEIIGKHFSVFYPQEDVLNAKPQDILATAARNGQSEDEGWRVRKDGARFWANVVITALRDPSGNLLGFAKLTRDMSERREKEEALAKAKELLETRIEQRAGALARVNEELRTEIAGRERTQEQLRASRDQLRALAGRLQTAREEERTLISREIHDELGQACTAIKMDLALIGRKLSRKRTPLRAKVESAMQLVDSAIITMHRIAWELRPRALDDFGLTAALESLAHEFENRTGIRCTLKLPQQPFQLDPDRSTAIFRIFQESLTNVARHAQATRVRASLEKGKDRLVFQVFDNGIGIDPARASTGKSLGLVGMQERALMLNGELKIEGAPRTGTTLTLTVPLTRSAPGEKIHDESPDC